MNELIQPEFEILTNCVPVDQRPALAVLMDRVEEYEAGDFSGSLDYLDLFSAINRNKDEDVIRALNALLRIVRYCHEICRVGRLGDSTAEETRT
jgi:hypothetical protein